MSNITRRLVATAAAATLALGLSTGVAAAGQQMDRNSEKERTSARNEKERTSARNEKERTSAKAA